MKNTEQLTLEDLAPYLPYELRAELLDYQSDYVGKQYDTIVGIHQWDNNGKYWSALTIGGSKPNIERIKPILRPLSDLTKEIEHNGEKFVPIIELAKEFHITSKYVVTHYGDVWDEGYMSIGCKCYVENSNSRYSEFYIHGGDLVLHNDFRIVKKLHEWHFWTGDQSYFDKGLIIDKSKM